VFDCFIFNFVFLLFIISILSLYISIIIGKPVVKLFLLISCCPKTFLIPILSTSVFTAVIF